MSDWKLGRRRGACADCDRDFLEQEPHHSILILDGLEIARVDLCRDCFAKREVEDGTLWWRTKHRVTEKTGVQLDLDSIHALFGALGAREEQGWLELRYLLCLILMRKRRLKVVGVKRENEGEFFVVRRPRVEGEERVRVFDFSPERRAELRETLHAIFEGAELDELDPDGARAEAASREDEGEAPDGTSDGTSDGVDSGAAGRGDSEAEASVREPSAPEAADPADDDPARRENGDAPIEV